jgi:hypothetical protein
MDSTTYTFENRQRRNLLLLAFGYPSPFLAVAVFGLLVGNSGQVVFFGALTVATALRCINLVSSRTTVDAVGIHGYRYFRRWSCAWEQMELVTVKERRTRQGTMRQVVIRGIHGGTWRLPVPGDPLAAIPDPDFADRAEAIVAEWRVRRAA